MTSSFRLSAFAVAAICGSLIGCDLESGFFNQTGSAEGLKAKQQTLVGEESDGVLIAAVDKDAKTTQVAVADPTWPIAGATVAFPPGSLAVSTTISMQEGQMLADDSFSASLGLGGAVGNSAPSVMVMAGTAQDAIQPFVISIPAPSGGMSLLAADNIVVFYKIKVAATNATMMGVMPSSMLKLENGNVVFSVQHFGVFQAVLVSKVVESKVEMATEQAILSKVESTAVVDAPAPASPSAPAPAPSPGPSNPRPSTLTVSVPVDGDTFNASASSLTMSGACSPLGGKVRVSAWVTLETTCTAAGWTLALPFSGAADGSLVMTAEYAPTGFDAATPIKRTIVRDTTGPTVTISAGASPVPVAALSSHVIDGTCSDAGRPVLVTTSGETKTVTCSAGHAWSAVFDLSAYADGSIAFNATSTDAAGNSSGAVGASTIKDTVPPLPGIYAGTRGEIATMGIGVNGVGLVWGKATDAATPQAALRYKVCYSPAPNLSSVADLQSAQCNDLSGLATDIDSFKAKGLPRQTGAHFNVLVVDLAGNAAAYVRQGPVSTRGLQVTYSKLGTAYGEVHHAKSLSSGWASSFVLEGTSPGGVASRLAVDNSNYPHVLVLAGSLYLRSFNGTAWDAESILASGMDRGRLDFGALSGKLHVSATGGSQWKAAGGTTLSGASIKTLGSGSFTSLAQVPFSATTVFTFAASSGNIVTQSSSNGGIAWLPRSSVATGVSSQCLAAATDGTNLHVLSVQSNALVHYESTDQGTTWSGPTTIGPSASCPHDGSLQAMADKQGNVHVMWLDASPNNKTIKYQKYTHGDGWLAGPLPVKTAQAVDPNFSFAVDEIGELHVAYHDFHSSKCDLEYFHGSPNSWSTTEIVDDDSNDCANKWTGRLPSLRINR